MEKQITIGLVVPAATDVVPPEGQIYATRFLPRGVGVRSLTPAGFDAAVDAILPAAEHLAAQGVDAIMVMGTSLTFYRGAEFNSRLIEDIRSATGLPASTMSSAVVDGLRALGKRSVVVCTAYGDEVNRRLHDFLTDSGVEVLALEGFGILDFGVANQKTDADIVALSDKLCAEAPEAEALVISCGGLRTLAIPKPFEEEHGIPVVTSTQAGYWAAHRLAGLDGRVAGYGRLLETAAA